MPSPEYFWNHQIVVWKGFPVCDNSFAGKAFEINSQCFAVLYVSCSACSLRLDFLFFIIIPGYRWRLFKDALKLRMDFVTILMLLCSKSYVMSFNFVNSLFLMLKSLFCWALMRFKNMEQMVKSNACGFSGCSEQQLTWVSISPSPTKRRCEGWQPGFPWDRRRDDCSNNDCELCVRFCAYTHGNVDVFHMFWNESFCLFLVSLSDVLNVM